MLNNCSESNSVGRGRSDFSVTVYLSGVSIVVHHRLYAPSVEPAELGIAHAQKIPLDVVAGELAARVVRSRPCAGGR